MEEISGVFVIVYTVSV